MKAILKQGYDANDEVLSGYSRTLRSLLSGPTLPPNFSLTNSVHVESYELHDEVETNSVCNKLLPKIFVWKDGLDYDKQEANRFVQHILKFLSVASKRYSKEEFAGECGGGRYDCAKINTFSICAEPLNRLAEQLHQWIQEKKGQAKNVVRKARNPQRRQALSGQGPSRYVSSRFYLSSVWNLVQHKDLDS